MDVRAFTRADIPNAAALLAARGNPHPLVAPFDAAAEIEALLDAGATGYTSAGGFLLGSVDDDAAWCHYAGHAARDVTTYRHLYRALAGDWVDSGQRRHAVVMPDGDPVAEPAFANLAFGREHVFALAALADQPAGSPDPRVAVRTGSIEDYEALRPFFGMLARHLTGSPVFSPRPAAYWEWLPDRFREDMADPNVTYLLASVDHAVVGFASWEPMPPRIAVPEGAFALRHMVVAPRARGRGAGRALALAGLALARERGHTVTWTDWRLTNMSAEPYWRTYGWGPYQVRMTRRIDPDA